MILKFSLSQISDAKLVEVMRFATMLEVRLWLMIEAKVSGIRRASRICVRSPNANLHISGASDVVAYFPAHASLCIVPGV